VTISFPARSLLHEVGWSLRTSIDRIHFYLWT